MGSTGAASKLDLESDEGKFNAFARMARSGVTATVHCHMPQRFDRLFDEALDLPAEERGAFLEEHWVRREWSSEEAKQKFETMGTQPPYHYLGSGRIYALVRDRNGEGDYITGVGGWVADCFGQF